MLQQLMTENRFVSLAPDDPDNSDTDPEVTEPHISDKPRDDVSTVSDGTVYYEVNDDTPYFQTGAEPPHERNGKLPTPINFRDINGVLRLSHQLDAIFRSAKEIETPLGMDTTQQMWRWADVGSCHMPRSPPKIPHPYDRRRGRSSTCC